MLAAVRIYRRFRYLPWRLLAADRIWFSLLSPPPVCVTLRNRQRPRGSSRLG